MSDPAGAPRPHPLENPFIWFLVQAAEIVVVMFLLWLVLPAGLPLGVGWAIFVALVVGLTVVNYAIRRRFVPH